MMGGKNMEGEGEGLWMKRASEHEWFEEAETVRQVPKGILSSLRGGGG